MIRVQSRYVGVQFQMYGGNGGEPTGNENRELRKYLCIAVLLLLGDDDDEIVIDPLLTRGQLWRSVDRLFRADGTKTLKRNSCLAEMKSHVDQPIIACGLYCRNRGIFLST